MGALADRLGGKAPGELIRAKDWNDLVAATEEIDQRLSKQVSDLGQSLGERLTALETRVEGAEGRISAVETRTGALEGVVSQLAARFRRVALRTEQLTYALGQSAEIVAQVTDLAGAPLDLTDAASRPWIDFVTTWGQLKPVPEFESLGGVGDRTLSVRVNQAGEARVRLRGEHVEGLTEDVENEMEASLQTAIPANQNATLAQTILSSATPMEANLKGAYRVMSAEYEREGALGVRSYLDQYYVRDPGRFFAPGVLHQRWRDHRTVVLALAKPDSDPLTPDASLGAASVQVTFRDWIPAWFGLDYYVMDRPAIKATLIQRVRPRLGGDAVLAFNDTRAEVVEALRGHGPLKKLQMYRAMDEMFDEIGTPEAAPYIVQYRRTMKSAVAMQQSLERGLTADAPAAFESVAESALHTVQQTAGARQEASAAVAQQVAEAREQIAAQVSDISATIGTLRGLDATTVNTRLAFLGGLETRLQRLETRV